MPKPTHARKAAISADRNMRSLFFMVDLFGGAGVEYVRQARESDAM
jgi:hypothetical protein